MDDQEEKKQSPGAELVPAILSRIPKKIMRFALIIVALILLVNILTYCLFIIIFDELDIADIEKAFSVQQEDEYEELAAGVRSIFGPFNQEQYGALVEAVNVTLANTRARIEQEYQEEKKEAEASGKIRVPGTGPASDNPYAEQVIAYCQAQIGSPYSNNKRMLEGYYDCSSLVYRAYKAAGLTLEGGYDVGTADESAATTDTMAQELYEAGMTFSDRSLLQPGDIIFSKGSTWRRRVEMFDGSIYYIGHVRIYIGNGEMIHATGGGVLRQPVQYSDCFDDNGTVHELYARPQVQMDGQSSATVTYEYEEIGKLKFNGYSLLTSETSFWNMGTYSYLFAKLLMNAPADLRNAVRAEGKGTTQKDFDKGRLYEYLVSCLDLEHKSKYFAWKEVSIKKDVYDPGTVIGAAYKFNSTKKKDRQAEIQLGLDPDRIYYSNELAGLGNGKTAQEWKEYFEQEKQTLLGVITTQSASHWVKSEIKSKKGYTYCTPVYNIDMTNLSGMGTQTGTAALGNASAVTTQGLVAKATIDTTNLKDVADGSAVSYEMWDRDETPGVDKWSKNTMQKKLHDDFLHFDENGLGKINDFYMVATTSTWGEVGDIVVFRLSNGVEIPTVIGDEKNQDDDDANKWGHEYGQVVLEFMVKHDTFYTREASVGHDVIRKVTGFTKGERVVGATNYGCYYNTNAHTYSSSAVSTSSQVNENVGLQPLFVDSEEDIQEVVKMLEALDSDDIGGFLFNAPSTIKALIRAKFLEKFDISKYLKNIQGFFDQIIGTGQITYYNQGDYSDSEKDKVRRWYAKGVSYGTIKGRGCGICSFAMLASAYGIDITPNDVADMANQSLDFCPPDNHDAFRNLASHFGVPSIQEEMDGPSQSCCGMTAYDRTVVEQLLRDGCPMILSVTGGTYNPTGSGHYIMVYGMGVNGVRVYDPGSRARYEKSKEDDGSDIDDVFSHAKHIWIFPAPVIRGDIPDAQGNLYDQMYVYIKEFSIQYNCPMNCKQICAVIANILCESGGWDDHSEPCPVAFAIEKSGFYTYGLTQSGGDRLMTLFKLSKEKYGINLTDDQVNAPARDEDSCPTWLYDGRYPVPQSTEYQEEHVKVKIPVKAQMEHIFYEGFDSMDSGSWGRARDTRENFVAGYRDFWNPETDVERMAEVYAHYNERCYWDEEERQRRREVARWVYSRYQNYEPTLTYPSVTDVPENNSTAVTSNNADLVPGQGNGYHVNVNNTESSNVIVIGDSRIVGMSEDVGLFSYNATIGAHYLYDSAWVTGKYAKTPMVIAEQNMYLAPEIFPMINACFKKWGSCIVVVVATVNDVGMGADWKTQSFKQMLTLGNNSIGTRSFAGTNLKPTVYYMGMVPERGQFRSSYNGVTVEDFNQYMAENCADSGNGAYISIGKVNDWSGLYASDNVHFKSSGSQRYYKMIVQKLLQDKNKVIVNGKEAK